ncbi:MAG: terminase small subunit [Turneriella sp.]
MKGDTLSPKQELFVHHYLILLNGRKAAIKAGYSTKTATSIASEYLTKPNIRKAIQAAMDETIGEHKLTLKGRVIKGYMDIAFGKKVANADRIKALDALAKYEQLWTDQPASNININVFAKELISEGQ